MVTELIEHIEVYHTEKIDGVKTQKLVIYYNCIGAIEIPDDVPIPEADITMKTRKRCGGYICAGRRTCSSTRL